METIITAVLGLLVLYFIYRAVTKNRFNDKPKGGAGKPTPKKH